MTRSSSPPHDDDLLPVRSVNAHTFCPRLFWLEDVAGLFAENEHVTEGLAAHRRVDKPGGVLPAPDGDDEPWHARSLWLASPELGVSGKLDLVEEADGLVMPVDTKKGRAPREGGLWPADAVQLALQGLLLREAGYRCEKVAAFYKAERRRVIVDLDPSLVNEAKAAVSAALETRALRTPPAPLVDSPKCRGCSLNLVCQPDETNLLSGRTDLSDEASLRRVVPANADAVPAYIASPGAKVGVRGDSLVVKPPEHSDEETITIGLKQTSQVNLLGTAQMTTQAIRACLDEGVPIHFLSTGGFLYGIASGDESRAVHVRIAQFGASGTEAALRVARVLIADKIANQRTFLRRNLDDGAAAQADLARLARLVDEASSAESPERLLAREGEAAKKFWAAFSELAARDEPEFRMNGRSKRPPRDATNAMLSFASSLLVKDCALAVRAAGLDPYLGVYHTPHHGRPSMALDLMEPFRPLIVDSTVLGIIRRGEVSPRGFVNTGQAVAMKAHTRKALIAAYERRMQELVTHPVFRYRISYRQVLSVQARLLARALVGEIPEMASFRTR